MLSKLILLQTTDLDQYVAIQQENQRLKITSFDICSSYIVLGSNSGTLYFLDTDSLLILYQLPSQNGKIIEISISPDDGYLAYATSSGLVFINQVPGQNSSLNIHPTSSSEHEGKRINVLTWAPNGSELYVGDKDGNLSVLHAPSSFASSFLMNLTHHLLHFDSSIIQLDVHDHYLLVSTLTKSYICNTRLETYSQIGTKPRNGVFGGCFCSVELQRNFTTNGSNSNVVAPTEYDLAATKVCNDDKLSTSDENLYAEPELKYESRLPCRKREKSLGGEDIFKLDNNIMNLLKQIENRIFCVRPGSRLWEADFRGKVLATHQFKYAMIRPPNPVIDIQWDTFDSALWIENQNEPFSLSNNFPQISLKQIFRFYDNFLIGTSSLGLHLIDPQQTKIILWTLVIGGVDTVKIHSNSIMYSTSSTGKLNKLIITTVDIAILTLHSKEQYDKCAGLCIKYSSLFENSYLLKQFGKGIIKDLLCNLKNREMFQGIDNIRRSLLASDLVGYRITSSCIKIENSQKNSDKTGIPLNLRSRLINSHKSEGEFSTHEESLPDSRKIYSPKLEDSCAESDCSSRRESYETNVQRLNMCHKSENGNLIYVNTHSKPKSIGSIRKESPFHSILGNFTSNLVNSFTSSTKSIRNTLKESISFTKTEEFIKKLNPLIANGDDYSFNGEDPPVCCTIQASEVEPIVIPASKSISLSKNAFQRQNFLSEIELKKIECKMPTFLLNYQKVVSETREKVPYCESHSELEAILIVWLTQFLDTLNDIKGSSSENPADTLNDDSSSFNNMKKESSKLFILSFKRKIFIPDKMKNSDWMVKFPQHFLTPEEGKFTDSFYGSIIDNDIGLLNYSYILNNLIFIDSNLLYHSWISLMKKVTETDYPRNVSLTNYSFITEIEFNRVHRVQYLKKLIFSQKSLNEIISLSCSIKHSTVLYDIYYFTHYVSDLKITETALHDIDVNLVLHDYLKEVSLSQNIQALYLKQWSECPEIQYQIIASLLSTYRENPNTCPCGFPLPAAQTMISSKVLEGIFSLPLYHPVQVSNLCQIKGYFYGYLILNLKYKLCELKNLVDIILQTFCKNSISVMFDNLNADYGIDILNSLSKLKGSSNTSVKCLNCFSQLKIVSSYDDFDDSSSILSFLMIDRHCLVGEDNFFKKEMLSTYSEFLNFVFANILKCSNSSFSIMQMLNRNWSKIPQEVCKKTLMTRLIVTALAEREGTSLRLAMMKKFTESPRCVLSLKAMRALDAALVLHKSKLCVVGNEEETLSTSSKMETNKTALEENEKLVPKICVPQNVNEDKCPSQLGTGHSGGYSQFSQPQSSVSHQSNTHSIGHHWGIKVQILTGICQLCHLGLTVEAMVNAGGLTIFSCGHAYHTVCLYQHGRSCVICVNNRVN